MHVLLAHILRVACLLVISVEYVPHESTCWAAVFGWLRRTHFTGTRHFIRQARFFSPIPCPSYLAHQCAVVLGGIRSILKVVNPEVGSSEMSLFFSFGFVFYDSAIWPRITTARCGELNHVTATSDSRETAEKDQNISF